MFKQAYILSNNYNRHNIELRCYCFSFYNLSSLNCIPQVLAQGAQMLRFLVKENNNLSNYDIDLDEVGTRYIEYFVDKHNYKEQQQFNILTWLKNKATIDI